MSIKVGNKMKYMTKEWYQAMQNIHHHTFIKHIDEKVKNFSNSYFNKIYIKEEQAQKELYGPIDFNNYFNARLNDTQKLPDTILNEVSDIRMLALGYATQETYDKIKEYSIANYNAFEKAMKDYHNCVKKQFKNKIPDFEKESFHDSQITNFAQKGNDYIIEIDNEGAFTEINNIVFKSAEIVKQEGPIEKSWWLYNEIYKVDGKYEIHFLLWSDDALNDLILTCDDIILN